MKILQVLLVVATFITLARWTCLAIVTFSYHFQPELEEHKSFHTNNSLIGNKLLAMGNLLAQTLRVLQYPALMYGLRHFSVVLKPEWKFKKIISTFKCKSSAVCSCSTCCLGLVILAYTLVTFVPPILLMVWFRVFVEWDNHMLEKNALVGFMGLELVYHISDYLVRLAFFVVTLLTVSTWTCGKGDLKSIVEDNAIINDCKKFKELVKKYKEIGELVAKLQYIFEVWFVLAWGIYFIGLTGNTVFILEMLINGKDYDENFWVFVTHLINDIAAFTVPYFCGALINYYHDVFHTALGDMQDKMFERCETFLDCIALNASAVPKKSKYDFTPAILCINIPLESAGFTLTIILTIIAFVLSLVSVIIQPKDIP